MSKHCNKKYKHCDSSEYIVHKGKWKRCDYDDCDDDCDTKCHKVLVCKEERCEDDHHHHDHDKKEENKCKGPIILRAKRVRFYDDGGSCVPSENVRLELTDAVFPVDAQPPTSIPFVYRFDLPVECNGCGHARAITNVDFAIDILGIVYTANIPGGSAVIALEVLSGAKVIFSTERTLFSGVALPYMINEQFTRKLNLFNQVTVRARIVSESSPGGSVAITDNSNIQILVRGRGYNKGYY